MATGIPDALFIRIVLAKPSECHKFSLWHEGLKNGGGENYITEIAPLQFD